MISRGNTAPSFFTKESSLLPQEIFWTWPIEGIVINDLWMDSTDVMWHLGKAVSSLQSSWQFPWRYDWSAWFGYMIFTSLADRNGVCHKVFIKLGMRHDISNMPFDVMFEMVLYIFSSRNEPHKEAKWSLWNTTFIVALKDRHRAEQDAKVTRYTSTNHLLVYILEQERTGAEI